jgi:hypothetical protein
MEFTVEGFDFDSHFNFDFKNHPFSIRTDQPCSSGGGGQPLVKETGRVVLAKSVSVIKDKEWLFSAIRTFTIFLFRCSSCIHPLRYSDIL